MTPIKSNSEDVVKEQGFALAISKVCDSKGNCNLEIKTKNNGMNMAEAFLVIRGWVESNEKKFTSNLFEKKWKPKPSS